MKIISLGWGVQSFTLVAMVALGELEPVDYAIHADTTYERTATYQFAAKWSSWLEDHGVKVITTVNDGPQSGIVDSAGGGVSIPAFTLDDGKLGQVRRQCTHKWKRAPMRRWLQENRNGEPVEQWLGISKDEALRMRESDVKYIVNRWPLIEKQMTRSDCVKWLQEHNLEVPTKSSCVFCPFMGLSEWRDIKNHGNGDWKKAVEIDSQIRKVQPPGDLYLWRTGIPLDKVDLRTPSEKGQLSLWDEECSGICGV